MWLEIKNVFRLVVVFLVIAGVGVANFGCTCTKSSSEAPVIKSFTAKPGKITAGQISTLSWEVTGANHISIIPGAESAPAKGDAMASPSATTTYTLLATNDDRSANQTVTVTVEKTLILNPNLHIKPSSPSLIIVPGILPSSTPTPSPNIGNDHTFITLPGFTSGPTTEECEQKLFDRVNAAKWTDVTPNSTRNSIIDEQCRQHAQYMMEHGAISHDGIDQRVAYVQQQMPEKNLNVCAEDNLSWPTCDVDAIVQAWFSDNEIRGKMAVPWGLSGIGIVKDSNSTLWICQMFFDHSSTGPIEILPQH